MRNLKGIASSVVLCIWHLQLPTLRLLITGASFPPHRWSCARSTSHQQPNYVHMCRQTLCLLRATCSRDTGALCCLRRHLPLIGRCSDSPRLLYRIPSDVSSRESDKFCTVACLTGHSQMPALFTSAKTTCIYLSHRRSRHCLARLLLTTTAMASFVDNVIPTCTAVLAVILLRFSLNAERLHWHPTH